MALPYNYSKVGISPDRSVAPGLILMGSVLFVVFLIFLLSSGVNSSFPYMFLLPWIIAMALVFSAPLVILHFRGKFSFADPICFAVWSYFFPVFIIGGIFLATGLSQPYFLSYIQDPEYNLPYTAVLIMAGFAAMCIGYFLPFGKKIGEAIERRLPKANYDPASLFVPAMLLMILGFVNTAVAVFLGVIGYQRAEEIQSYDGLIFLSTLLWLQGCFLLWYIVFRLNSINFRHILVLGLTLATVFIKAAFSGSRGGLLQFFLLIVFAFALSGRKLRFRHGIIAGAFLAVGILGGTIYATLFRQVKGDESQVNAAQYSENVFDTFEQLGRQSNAEALELGFNTLYTRLDVLSSAAVVVSNYEQLQPYEESYGLDNNIYKDLTTFFIPRVIWADKPMASDPRRYSDLYFNYGESSFAITPIADLLRNYGLAGVPIGMLLFGIVLRMIYRTLVEDQSSIVWRLALYFMMIILVSYEGFYSIMIQNIFKFGITSVAGILVLFLFARALGHRSVPVPLNVQRVVR